MIKKFILVSHIDKPIRELEMKSNTKIVCECGEEAFKVMPQLFKCSKCNREYMGPIMQR